MSLMLLCKGIIGLETLTGRARKSAAEWCFLLSCLFIVPLLIALVMYLGVEAKAKALRVKKSTA